MAGEREGLSPVDGNVKMRAGGEEGRGDMGSVLRWHQSCNNTMAFYVCGWEEITIWFMNRENQSDIATVVLRMWTVCLIQCMIKRQDRDI